MALGEAAASSRSTSGTIAVPDRPTRSVARCGPPRGLELAPPGVERRERRRRACGSSCSPASVRLTLRVVRSNSLTPESRLELLDLRGQRLLGDEQPLGRAGEVQLLGDRDERAQQPRVEIHHRAARIYNRSRSIVSWPWLPFRAVTGGLMLCPAARTRGGRLAETCRTRALRGTRRQTEAGPAGPGQVERSVREPAVPEPPRRSPAGRGKPCRGGVVETMLVQRDPEDEPTTMPPTGGTTTPAAGRTGHPRRRRAAPTYAHAHAFDRRHGRRRHRDTGPTDRRTTTRPTAGRRPRPGRRPEARPRRATERDPPTTAPPPRRHIRRTSRRRSPKQYVAVLPPLLRIRIALWMKASVAKLPRPISHAPRVANSWRGRTRSSASSPGAARVAPRGSRQPRPETTLISCRGDHAIWPARCLL